MGQAREIQTQDAESCLDICATVESLFRHGGEVNSQRPVMCASANRAAPPSPASFAERSRVGGALFASSLINQLLSESETAKTFVRSALVVRF